MTTYSTNLTHFLTKSGNYPPDLPAEAKQLAEFLGSIVMVVSKSASNKYLETTHVTCIQEKRGKTCDGIIQAGFSNRSVNAEIEWYCPKCRCSGVITGWKGTIWDMIDGLLHENTIH